MRTFTLLLSGVLLALSPPIPVEILKSTGGLPAHIAGSFDEISACEQTADGEYFIFDRRAHAVFSVARGAEAPRTLVRIGAEAGRILRPTAFDLADDGTFVVADAPEGRGRVQVFFTAGASLGGFLLPGREVPLIVLDGLVVSGIGSLEYTGKSVLLGRPDDGALVTEFAMDGHSVRSFGTLRKTGHEDDRDLHLALNAGLVVANPRGGYYFVFLAGTPMFRKYDAAGRLLFERHIEGAQLDDYVRNMPTRWPKRKNADGNELPLVQPAVRAAGADAEGNLWVSLAVPYTYIYDSAGDKRRIVQFRAAGVLMPTSLFFTKDGRVLATPGCYAFPAR